MSRRRTICFALAVAALVIVIALLTTAAALGSPPPSDEPPAPTIAEGKLPGEDTPAHGFATLDREALGEFKLTAYCPCVKCCGKSDGITATGTQAAEGRTIAVDPAIIPYGSIVTLYYEDGTVHTYTAEDCGGAIKENRIDVFFSDHEAARVFGVQRAMVYVEAAA